MYVVSGKEQVRELESVPGMCPGAPCPVLVATDTSISLAYFANADERNVEFLESPSHLSSTEGGDEACVAIAFTGAHAHYLGSPNDEALSGHPLYDRGLRPYGVFEILSSSWISSLEVMNRVHPMHDSARYRDLRHFVITFHDSTFECIASSYSVKRVRGSPSSVLGVHFA